MTKMTIHKDYILQLVTNLKDGNYREIVGKAQERGGGGGGVGGGGGGGAGGGEGDGGGG